MGFQAGAYRSVLRLFSFGDGRAWRGGRVPGDLIVFFWLHAFLAKMQIRNWVENAVTRAAMEKLC